MTSKSHTLGISSHAMIILASGESQRLGQPKQLLNQQGLPLICKALQLAILTQPSIIVVVVPSTLPEIAKTATDFLDTEAIPASVLSRVHIVHNHKSDLGISHSLNMAINLLYRLNNPINNHKSSVNSKTNYYFDSVCLMVVDQIHLDIHHLQQLLDASKINKAICNKQRSHKKQNNEEKNFSFDVVASRYPKNANSIKQHDIDNKDRWIVGVPLVINWSLLKQWQSELSGDRGLRYLIRTLQPKRLKIIDAPELAYDIDTPEQLAKAQKQGWLDK